jgi:hypothetical protein
MKCNKCGSAMAFSHVHIDLDTEKATTYFKCYHCKRLWPEIENNDAGVVATSPAKDGGPAEPAEPVSMPEWEQLRLETDGYELGTFPDDGGVSGHDYLKGM